MKRLTIRNSDGSVSQPTHSTFEKVFNRLAEYEDTEMTPEEIEEMKIDNCNNEALLLEQYENRDYTVEITETSRKSVIIRAEGKKEAEEMAKKNWENGEYIFDEQNFVGVAFDVV